MRIGLADVSFIIHVASSGNSEVWQADQELFIYILIDTIKQKHDI